VRETGLAMPWSKESESGEPLVEERHYTLIILYWDRSPSMDQSPRHGTRGDWKLNETREGNTLGGRQLRAAGGGGWGGGGGGGGTGGGGKDRETCVFN